MDQQFMDALKTHTEVDLTVTGRKTGQQRRFPVWFVLEGAKMYLLPIYGSHTSWYKNVVAHPHIQITAGDRTVEVDPLLLTDAEKVAHVIHLFSARYGKDDIPRYYSVYDAALEVDLAR